MPTRLDVSLTDLCSRNLWNAPDATSAEPAAGRTSMLRLVFIGVSVAFFAAIVTALAALSPDAPLIAKIICRPHLTVVMASSPSTVQ